MNYSDVEKKGFALAYNKKAAKKKKKNPAENGFDVLLKLGSVTRYLD